MATKQYSSKVCYVFSGLTIAFVIALIYWVYQEKDISTTPTFQNSDLKVNTETNCMVEPLVGDGYCDDEANNAECDFDLDDCCDQESDRNSCTNCTCWVDNDQLVKFNDQLCHDFSFALGDGICDMDYNNKEYFFDIGDCCLKPEPELGLLCVQNQELVTCPDNLCIESNHYCIEHELGDGICQDYNNGPYCNYDLGDCCSTFDEAYEDCCTCACHTFSPFDPYFHQFGFSAWSDSVASEAVRGRGSIFSKMSI